MLVIFIQEGIFQSISADINVQPEICITQTNNNVFYCAFD